MPLSPANKKDLWLRLRDYHFENLVQPGLVDKLRERFGGEEASTRAFAAKIARKHGWKSGFALRALGEYRKFLFLGQVSPAPVTPSTVMDTVWHEHLLFSKGYREFCDTVLGRPFDHNPELLPEEEQTARFREQYLATLALYETEFGYPPPAAFWGHPKFSTALLDKQQKKKETDNGDSGNEDAALHHQFADEPAGDYPEFAGFGEGDGGGGGADGGWGDSSDAGDGGGDGGGCSGGD